jgi:hypothetical protein
LPLSGALYGKEKLVDESQLNWNRYITHIDLYKFIFELMTKLNIFFYGITGAILSFYLSKAANGTDLEYVLLLPIFFGLGISALAIYGDITLKHSKADIEYLVNKMDISVGIQTNSLNYVIRFSSLFCVVTSIVVAFMFCSDAI